MISLATAVPRIFRLAWERYGKPTISVVPPLADWTLPAGYAYDASLDGIVTGGGAVLTSLYAMSGYFATTEVNIVPTHPSGDTRSLMAAGIIPDGQIEVLVLATDLPTMRAAFAVQVGGLWYNLPKVQPEPIGTTDVWARVRLERRS